MLVEALVSQDPPSPLSRVYLIENPTSGIRLAYANKVLDVYIFWRDMTANTFIYNVVGKTALQGTTSLLYQRANDILREAATLFKRPIEYTFSSENPQMKSWALKSGRRIFDWDTIDYSEELPSFLVCRKVIYSSNYQANENQAEAR